MADETETPQRPTHFTPEVTPVYASSLQYISGGNDFTLVFSQHRPLLSLDGDAKKSSVGTEVTAIIMMAPSTIKDLYLLTKSAVEQHEREFGEIVTPFTKDRLGGK